MRNYLFGKYEGRREVSGILCLVYAEEKLNKIVGKLSCARSNRPFNFEFKPIPVDSYKGTRINFEKELERLYFTESIVHGKRKLELEIKEVEESAEFLG